MKGGFRQRIPAPGARPLISVHRGLWGAHPENSLAAIRAARAFDVVEVDLRLSADGAPVLMHDDTLARMTGLDRRCDAVSLSESLALPLKSGAGGPQARATAERVPSLAEALRAGGPDLLFDLDVKDEAEIGPVAAEVVALGCQAQCTIKIDTATDADIVRLKALERQYGVPVVAKVVLPRAGLAHISALAAAGVAMAELWFGDPEQLKQAVHAAGPGMAIGTYTLDEVHCAGLSDSAALGNPAAVWGVLRASGVRLIMTDRAPELAAFLAGQP